MAADTKYTNEWFYTNEGCGPQKDLKFKIRGTIPETGNEELQPGFANISPTRHCNRQGRKEWILNEPYSYCYKSEDSHELIMVEEDFMTDLTSIPTFARLFYDPADFPEAAIVHDYLYAIGMKGDEESRRKADNIFRAIAIEAGNSHRRAFIIHFAISTFGRNGFGKDGNADYKFWDREFGEPETKSPAYARPFQTVTSCETVFVE